MSDTHQAILWGGTLCGVLDGAAATWWFGTQGIPPRRVWQGVASALLGEQSFMEGWGTGYLGLLLHFLVAFTAATVFCLAAKRSSQLARAPVMVGALYGIVVFLVTNLIVIPLSARPKRPITTRGVVAQVIIHIICVGLPISLSASHFLR